MRRVALGAAVVALLVGCGGSSADEEPPLSAFCEAWNQAPSARDGGGSVDRAAVIPLLRTAPDDVEYAVGLYVTTLTKRTDYDAEEIRREIQAFVNEHCDDAEAIGQSSVWRYAAI